MLTKNKVKLINSLAHKKYRKEHMLFVVEGEKMVDELINEQLGNSNCRYKIQELFYTLDFKQQRLEDLREIGGEQHIVTDKELIKISNFTTPNKVFAVVEIPKDKIPLHDDGLILLVDGVVDPGNLGNIIRCSDWFGIEHVICSTNCVGLYNPKVVQASMGAIFRTNVLYTDLVAVVKKLKRNNPLKPIYGATLNGENVYNLNLNQNAAVAVGSESHGISPELKELLTKEIKIPKLGKGESLNVASATAVLCSEFKRYN